MIELADAPHLRMVGNLATSAEAPINSVTQDRVAIGDAVTVAFRPVTDDVTLPVWIPTPQSEAAR